MSINLGIYDFFAYLVPGFLYLFLLNAFSNRIGWASYNLANANQQIGIGTIGILALAAYIAGHIMDAPAHWFCYKLLIPRSMSVTGLEEIKRQYPDLNILFEAKDYHLLFVLLRERNLQYTQVLDRFEANSILLKNISFGAALFAILQTSTLLADFNTANLCLLILSLVVCWLALRGSKMYHNWFFVDVFEASLSYGLSVQEVLANKKAKESHR